MRAAVHRVLHAVAAEDAGFRPIGFEPQLLTLGKQAGAGDSPQSLGDARAIDFDRQRFRPAAA